MQMSTHTTPSGYILPSIHSMPPFFTQQPNPATQATITGHWTRLILSYARHRSLFYLRVEDAEMKGHEWDEVLRNERINRHLKPSHLSVIMADMVSKNIAVYEPPKQTRTVLLYWRLPEEWAEVLHEWASSTGQLNIILTFYEIMEPPVPSPLSGIPIIATPDGEGVRFFAGNPVK